MSKLNLSDRLTKVASFLPEGANFADIGSDHAYLPSYVCLHDKTAKAIAGEVNEGPYLSAIETVKAFQLQGQVEVRLGDGLEIVKENEVKQIVIAGMGGSLIKSILDRGKSRLVNVQRIIAQPNVDARNVRTWFLENHYHLSDEVILEENGHTYEILVADKSSHSLYNDDMLEKELLFGPILLKNKSVVFRNKWQLEHDKLSKIILQMKNASNPDFTKIQRFEQELAWMKEVLYDEA